MIGKNVVSGIVPEMSSIFPLKQTEIPYIRLRPNGLGLGKVLGRKILFPRFRSVDVVAKT